MDLLICTNCQNTITLCQCEHTTTGQKPHLTETQCLEIIADHFGFTLSDLCSRDRHQELTEARHIAMYLLWKIDSYTLQQIGVLLGSRMPATVFHGINSIASKLLVNIRIKADVDILESQIRGLLRRTV